MLTRAVRGLRTPRLPGRRPTAVHPASGPPGAQRGRRAPPGLPPELLRWSARGGAGDGPPTRPETPAGGSTTSGSTACGGTKACGCPTRNGRSPSGAPALLVGAMCPIRPNVVWALDFQFDQTADGRTLKLLNVIDEFTRECLTIEVDRSIDADAVVTCLEKITTRATGTGLPALRQRSRVHRPCCRRLVPVQRGRHLVHRPGLPLAERLDRELQRSTAGRAPERSALRQPARGPGAHRGLADRLQQQPTAQRTRPDNPGRLRRSLEHQKPAHTRIARGSAIGYRSTHVGALQKLGNPPDVCLREGEHEMGDRNQKLSGSSDFSGE